MGVRYFESPFHATEPKEKADLLVIKTRLCALIRDAIAERGWTQAEAARELGVNQPRISNVVNGKVDKISGDTLMTLILGLGYRATAEDGRGSLFISIRREQPMASVH